MTVAVPAFRALRSGALTLHLITDDNIEALREQLRGYPDDAKYMLSELDENYLPARDKQGRPSNFGFYTTLDGALAGMTLLTIDSWDDLRGSTGADTLTPMRGRGVAPGSKPHLFHLAFELLGMHRLDTGCYVSNVASRRSIEKTPGFVREGLLRSYGRTDEGEFDDLYYYGILRSDWERLYPRGAVEVLT